MSITHAIWHCQYHIAWVPKYRYRVLTGPIREETYNCIQVFAGQAKGEVIELNIQVDHVHLITMVPPTVGFDGEMIRMYVKYQEKKERDYRTTRF